MAEAAAKVQKHSFDAEVGKILQLMIHSLYENKEIFLRELISNASDACDKLRYEALTKPEVQEEKELRITISADEEAKTLTITDTGVGMGKKDLAENLGTIARSGTQQYVEKLTGDAKKDMHLIGQFGVGFYSAFMVGDKVEVFSRRAGQKKVHKWESDGNGEYTLEESKETMPHGTKIVIHLREEEKEYLDQFRISHVVKTYSDHVNFPVVFIDKDGKEETINAAAALWLKPKSEITEEQYKEFYHHVAHQQDVPWMTLHNKAEGVVEYTNLLFIPTMRPFDLFHPDREQRVKLYVKRVFITETNVNVIPPYLRFLRGVVDSEDLPLNISRETLQNNAVLHKIRKSITNKVLGELKKKAKDDIEAYTAFWENFGPVLKEGLCDSFESRDKILEVARFHSTAKDGLHSLDDYIERMKDDQKYIYYITGDDLEVLKNSPQIEGLVKEGYEVLLLNDSIDDFWVNVTNDYKDKELRSATRAGLGLDGKEEEDISVKEKADREKEGKLDEPKLPEEQEGLINFFKESLQGNVSEVRISNKLTSSPVCLVVPEHGMDIRLERFMVENKQLPEGTAKILEINPTHPIITSLIDGLKANKDVEKLQNTAFLLFCQASIAEGEAVKDVVGFSKKLNALLEDSLKN